MHLKTLSLRGFKSFASATTMRLEPGITCVVGPNGSGKSNVVDALAWVMGEQGAKNLRGGNMADVIFAGTSGRPALGRAQVDLTIDNSDGLLPIDYSEVTITRTLFRGGGSEYAINGAPARLLDVQELLSDTGMGRQMHVIVGQGQLDAILSSTPEERRGFIEEAAGVLKHRRRKERALRKLGDMDQNLVRVLDLSSEIERQLRPLARQAKIARKASLIQARVRDARARLLADDVVTVQGKLETLGASERDQEQRRLRLDEKLRGLRRTVAELEARDGQAHPQMQEALDQWQQLSSLSERLRATFMVARERIATHSQPELEPPGETPEELEAKAQEASAHDADMMTEVEAAHARVDAALRARGDLERAEEESARELARVNRIVADHREKMARLTGDVSTAESRLEAAEAEAGRARQQVEAAHLRQRQAEEQAAVYGEVETAQETEATRALAAAQNQRDQARAHVDELLTQERDARAERARWEARRDALSQSLTPTDATSTLSDRDGSWGDVPSHLHIVPGYEDAVAALLTPFADAAVARSDDTTWEFLLGARDDGAGQVRIVTARNIEENADTLPSDVRAPGQWALAAVISEHLGAFLAATLTGAWLCDSLEDAREALRDERVTRVATRAGDVLTRYAVVNAGEGTSSPLALRAQYEEALERASQWRNREAEVQGELTDANTALDAAVRDANQALKALRAEDAERARYAQEAARAHSAAQASAAESARAQTVAERAQEQVLWARQQAEQARNRLNGVDASAPDVDVEAAQRQAEEASRAAKAAREEETQARLALRAAEEQSRHMQTKARSLRQAAARGREEREAYRRREARRRVELENAQNVAREAQDASQAAERALERARARHDALEEARHETSAALSEARQNADALAAQLNELTGESHRGEIVRAELTMRLEQLATRSLEELALEVDELVEHYGPHNLVPIVTEETLATALEAEEARVHRADQETDPADEAASDDAVPAADADLPTVPYVREEQIRALDAAQRELEKLGRINPLALEEHAALSKRHEFLVSQVQDLKKSKADLLNIIEDVDRLVEEAFRSAWEDTARQFTHTFSVLFPGGEGRLILTDPDSMLTTGIEIEARPAGKKVKRLSLLSGGERSLAALAFLVAIFQARPSPFYVMDEVEAALDDINLSRLLEIFRELRESSQLIVITHQKRTMEIADALYGVTMRDGVTKVVSQRLDASA